MTEGTRFTVAVFCTEPPGVVQCRLKTVWLDIATVCGEVVQVGVPALEVTEQELSSTLVADQLTVAVLPFLTRSGVADIESWGWLTVKVTPEVARPPHAATQVTV